MKLNGIVRLASLLAVAAGLALGACGGSAKDCAAACTKVYATCGQALIGQDGNPVPSEQCVPLCNTIAAADKQRTIDCIVGAQCAQVGACL